MAGLKEVYFGDFMGVKQESPNLPNPYHRATIPLFIAMESVLGTEVHAPELPEENALFVVSTHPDWVSVVHQPYAVLMATGRLPVMTPKVSLVNPNYHESSAVLEATGKSGDVFSGTGKNEDTSLLDRAKGVIFQGARHITAPIIRNSLDTIPVDRDNTNLSALRTTLTAVRQSFHDGRVVGTFLQWTRTPENSLENAAPFAATIMRQNPDVPVTILVQRVHGTGSPDEGRLDHPVLTFTEPFTLSESERKYAKEDIHEMLLDRTEAAMRQAGIVDIIRP